MRGCWPGPRESFGNDLWWKDLINIQKPTWGSSWEKFLIFCRSTPLVDSTGKPSEVCTWRGPLSYRVGEDFRRASSCPVVLWLCPRLNSGLFGFLKLGPVHTKVIFGDPTLLHFYFKLPYVLWLLWIFLWKILIQEISGRAGSYIASPSCPLRRLSIDFSSGFTNSHSYQGHVPCIFTRIYYVLNSWW